MSRPAMPIPDGASDLLGKMSDQDVAARFNVNEKTVRRWRDRLGVGPYRQQADHEWTAEEDALLGTESDRKVARRLGVTIEAVYKRRRRLGIAPHGNPGKRNRFSPMPGSVQSSKHTLTLSQSSAELIEELKPILLEEFVERGVPVREIFAWQVIEIALRESIRLRGLR